MQVDDSLRLSNEEFSKRNYVRKPAETSGSNGGIPMGEERALSGPMGAVDPVVRGVDAPSLLT